MIEPLPPCPYGKKQQHSLCAVLPDSSALPVLLFCSVCGMTKREVMDVPPPMDDLPSDALSRIAKR